MDRRWTVLLFILSSSRFVSLPLEDKEITRLRLKFDLLSLPYEEYHHLWSLTNAQNTGLDWSILSEPVRLPDNVQGGLGLVTVASVSSVTLDPVPVKELESKILPEAIEN